MTWQKNGKRPEDKQQYTKHTTEQHGVSWNTQLFNICILFRILIYFIGFKYGISGRNLHLMLRSSTVNGNFVINKNENNLSHL